LLHLKVHRLSGSRNYADLDGVMQTLESHRPGDDQRQWRGA
jgi:hypothetical protein